MRKTRRLALLATAFIGLASVVAFRATAAPPATGADALPNTIAQAREIRAVVNGRNRLVPGRKLLVTEASTTAVVGTLTLVTNPAEFRVVSTENGVYYALCSARATCPYPRRSASWSPTAARPQLQVLELALRTFLETSANLVVVSLPTRRPTWAVIERDDLLQTVDAPAVLARLTPPSATINAELRELVDRLTKSRLFVPVPLLPPSLQTIFAVSLIG